MRIAILGTLFGFATCRAAEGTSNSIASIIDKGDDYVKKLDALFASSPIFNSNNLHENRSSK